MVDEIVNITRSGFSIWFDILIIVLILLIGLIIFLIKKGRGDFKPTLWKVIVSILVVIFWIFLLSSIRYNVMCKPCPVLLHTLVAICPNDYTDWTIIKPICDCSCQSFNEMLTSNIKNILIPFLITYFIWSLFQKKKRKNK